jgi:hypothetical protein
MPATQAGLAKRRPASETQAWRRSSAWISKLMVAECYNRFRMQFEFASISRDRLPAPKTGA